VRILVVEDDVRIAAFVVKGLRAEGYSPVECSDGDEADYLLAHGDPPFDLVLLDLGLPGMAGDEVLRRIRRRDTKLPVIILSARAEVGEKVYGLDLGATDYVTKPFAFAELLARIRAAVRASGQSASNVLEVGDLRFDLLTKLAERAGRSIELAPREWSLLELFMRSPTAVLSRSRILSEVWDYDFDPGSNVVDVYVGYLRRKLNLPGLEPLFKTVRGAGYRML